MSRVSAILAKTLDDKNIDILKLYANRSLLILFYNNKCLGCTSRAIPKAFEFGQSYKHIQVIGIHSSFDDVNIGESDIKSIFTYGNLPFPIYLDNKHELFDYFNCEGTPHWILLSKKGIVLKSIFGSQTNALNRLFFSIEELQRDS